MYTGCADAAFRFPSAVGVRFVPLIPCNSLEGFNNEILQIDPYCSAKEISEIHGG